MLRAACIPARDGFHRLDRAIHLDLVNLARAVLELLRWRELRIDEQRCYTREDVATRVRYDTCDRGRGDRERRTWNPQTSSSLSRSRCSLSCVSQSRAWYFFGLIAMMLPPRCDSIVIAPSSVSVS